MDFSATAEIVKRDDERQIAYGWASVFEVAGAPVVDRQGDVIAPDEIQKAAHAFLSDSRIGKALHDGQQVGRIVESIVLTKEIQKALGVDLGKAGWFVGMHIPDPVTWERVKSGELPAFSIGGRGRRRDVEVPSAT